MQKTAQKRDIRDKVRESIGDAPEKVYQFFKGKKQFAEPNKEDAKKFFEIELKRVMNDLKKADDNIRSILVGEKIGEATVSVDGKAIKDILKSARKNFNRREYLTSVADLGLFHKKMFDVNKYIGTLDLSLAKIHHNFLNPEKGTPAWKQLEDLKTHMSSLAEAESEYFIKEAAGRSIFDFLHNLVAPRARSLAAWEKQYPNVAKEFREGASALLDHAESLLANTLSYLKEMGTARATRRPDDYMEAARQIQKEFKKFDSGDAGFRNYYDKVVKPYLQKQAEYEKEESKGIEGAPSMPPSVKVEDAKELGKEEVTAPKEPMTLSMPPTPGAGPTPKVPPPAMTPAPATPVPAASPAQQLELFKQPSTKQLELFGPTGSIFQQPASAVLQQQTQRQPTMLPPPPKMPRMTPEEMRALESQHSIAHQNFMESLEAMSGEHPRIVANYIAKYASSIQSNDPETAIELFAIVKRLRG